MSEIRSSSVDQRTFETNAQMLGAPRDTVRRKDLAKTASAESETESNDQIDLGEGTPDVQELAADAQRLAATRAAMASGTVQAGDVAPGEGEEAQAPPVTGAPAPGAPPHSVPQGGAYPRYDDPAPTPPPGGSSATQAAQAAQAAQQDAEQAQSIYAQMAADRQKALMQMWKIFQDLQTSIFEILQDSISYRQQVMNRVCDKWSEVLRG